MKWTHPSVKALVSKGEKRRARLVVSIKGKFTTWKRGQVVLAQRIGPNQYAIERLRWKKPRVALSNSLAGVPRVAFDFI
jgi:hypothetical protein